MLFAVYWNNSNNIPHVRLFIHISVYLCLKCWWCQSLDCFVQMLLPVTIKTPTTWELLVASFLLLLQLLLLPIQPTTFQNDFWNVTMYLRMCCLPFGVIIWHSNMCECVWCCVHSVDECYTVVTLNIWWTMTFKMCSNPFYLILVGANKNSRKKLKQFQRFYFCVHNVCARV